MAQGSKSKVRKITVKMAGGPHNGEGRPECQFPDPITGEMIGGQVAFIRMAMRYPHVTVAWARRQGKTKARQYLYQNETLITSGRYTAGILFPDQTMAAKVAENFIESWGVMVRDSRVNTNDQDRWIDLHPFDPPVGDPPKWFTPKLVRRWKRVQNGEPNKGARIYLWGAVMPQARKLQGFPFPFHRVDGDEMAEIDPTALQIVRPMLRDVKGHEAFSGTPWSKGIGNVQFEDFFNIGLDPTSQGWFSYRIPDGANPHVPATNLADARRSMTDDEIQQTMYAAFLSNAGSVFSNLDAVFILKPIDAKDGSLDWLRTLRSKYSMPSMEWWVYQPKPTPMNVYGASIDWARSPKGDYSVLTVFDLSTGQQVAVLRWRGEDFTAQMEIVLAVQAHYSATQLHSDANGMGMTMTDFMRRRHAVGFVGHRFSANSKPDYVRRMQVLFRDASISLIDCAVQRKEFKDFSAYEAEGIGSEKQVRYCAPEGKHDDMVAAVLHLGQTLTISGRQDPTKPDPEAEPLLDDKGNTTLALWGDGKVPFTPEDATKDADWRDVVLPQRR